MTDLQQMLETEACELDGCSERKERNETYRITEPGQSSLTARYFCRLNHAKKWLMRRERERGGAGE